MLGDKGNSVGSAGGSNYAGDGAGGQVNLDGTGMGGNNVLRKIDGRWTSVPRDSAAATGNSNQTYITPASYPPTAPTVPTPTALTAPPVTEVAPAAVAPDVYMDPQIAGRLQAATAPAPAPAPAVNTFRPSPPKTFATPATLKAAAAPKVNSTAVAAGLSGALSAAANPAPRDDRMPSAPSPKYSTPPSVDNSARLAAITRGPGLSDPTGYQTNITAVTSYPETPAGALDPKFNAQLNTAALNRESLLKLKNATPQQKTLLDTIAPHALLAAGAVGLDARTLAAQAMFESTSSKHLSKLSSLARKNNNLFGVKGVGPANTYWDGNTVNLPTKEVVNGQTVTVDQPFRAYDSPIQSVYDYARLMGTPRYASKLKGATTVQDQLSAIRSGGYATHAAQSYVDGATKLADKLSVGGAPTETQVAAVTPKYNIAGASMGPPAAKPTTTTDTVKTEAAKLAEAITKIKTDTAVAAGTLTSPYDVKVPTAIAAGTPTAAYDVKPQLLDDVRAKAQTAFDTWKKERDAKKAKEASISKAAGTLTSPYDAAEDLTKAAYDKAQVGVEDLTSGAYNASKVAGRPDVPVGSFPASTKLSTKVAGRPDVPVGSLPAAKTALGTTIAGRPDVPVSPNTLKAPPKAYDPTESMLYDVMPDFGKMIAPLNEAMMYYDKNKFSIGIANKMGLLQKPVTKVAGAAITQMQNYVKGLMAPVPKDVNAPKPGNLIAGTEYAKPPSKIAQTIVDHPIEAIEASPSLQQIAVSSPTFLQRVFRDAGKGGKNNVFERYVATMAAPRTPTTPATTSLSENDALTELFAALARSGFNPNTEEQDPNTAQGQAAQGQGPMRPSVMGQRFSSPPRQNPQQLMPSFRGQPSGGSPAQNIQQLMPRFRGQHSFA